MELEAGAGEEGGVGGAKGSAIGGRLEWGVIDVVGVGGEGRGVVERGAGGIGGWYGGG